LKTLDKNFFQELKSYAKPPLACLAIFEGIGILLEPSKTTWDWTDDKKLFDNTDGPLIQRLHNFDRDQVTDEQLNRLNKVLRRDECQAKTIQQVSTGCYALYLWLQAINQYSTERRSIHKLQ
jgi:hypothetical protein